MSSLITTARKRMLLLAGLLLLGGLGLAGCGRTQDLPSTPEFSPRSLVGASLEEVGQYAVAYTQARGHIASGSPMVLLVRPTTAAELASFGFGWQEFHCGEPPLTLVILKGDFDVSRSAGIRVDPSKWKSRPEHIAYAFDLRLGMPAMEQFGGDMRRALGDPGLPDPPGSVPSELGGVEAGPAPPPPPPPAGTLGVFPPCKNG
jgi:hypothetical protein